MDRILADVVAGTLLPRLSALIAAKKQALLQLKDAPGERRESWRVVVYLLSEKIRMQERKVAGKMSLLKYKTKGDTRR